MTHTTTGPVKASKVMRLVDLRVIAEPPRDAMRPWGWRDMTAEDRLLAVEKNLLRWVEDFHAFMRDHRSQDPVSLDVERVVQAQCSACGREWETCEDNGVTYCAGCDAVVS